jgi:hypothetical protein
MASLSPPREFLPLGLHLSDAASASFRQGGQDTGITLWGLGARRQATARKRRAVPRQKRRRAVWSQRRVSAVIEALLRIHRPAENERMAVIGRSPAQGASFSGTMVDP